MPSPWSVNDAVEVLVGSLWVAGTVAVVHPMRKYEVDLDTPLPTLSDCGLTHPIMPSSTEVNMRVWACEAPDEINVTQIRDPQA